MEKFDVIVVGMGPAGMSAAIELVERGLKVAVFDENPRPGGQVHRQWPLEFKKSGGGVPGLKNQAGQRLLDRFNQLDGAIQVFSNVLIWGIFGGELAYKRDNTCDGVGFDKLILCEGACERIIPFSGWTLPGIMTLGGIQRFILNQRLLPGKRILLAGSGPLLLAVAAEVLKAGAENLTLCEASNFGGAFKLMAELFRQKGLLSETVSYLAPILMRLIPLHRSCTVIAARGKNRLEEVEIAQLDDNWKPLPGSEKKLAADILGIGFGFQPMARLCRLAGCNIEFDVKQRAFKPVVDSFMRTSLPGIYAAGDSAGIGGARMAEVEGRIAALHAASTFGSPSLLELEQSHNRLLKQKKRIARYMMQLDEMFTPRSGIYGIIQDKTVVCRCEGTVAEDFIKAIKMGHLNLNAIKKRTRMGMGPCQGKTCEAIAVEMAARAGVDVPALDKLTIRPPIAPIPMSTMADYSEPGTGTM